MQATYQKKPQTSPQLQRSAKTPRQTLRPAALQLARLERGAASPADVQALQRAAGNQAVQRLLSRRVIQARLNVGPADDAYEREADRMAGRVVSGAATPAQGQAQVQRAPAPEAPAQAQAADPRAGFDAGYVGEAMEAQLTAQRGQGQPLPADLRANFEPRFGADFSGVRVHTDASAATLNRQLNAQAFTHGPDIYLDAGRYAPGTPSGQRLLAHELTHVVQQTGRSHAGVQRKSNHLPPEADLRARAKLGQPDKNGKLTAFEKILAAVKYYNDLAPNDFETQLYWLRTLEVKIATWEKRHAGSWVAIRDFFSGTLAKHRPIVQELKNAVSRETAAVQDQMRQSDTLEDFDFSNKDDIQSQKQLTDNEKGQMSTVTKVTYNKELTVTGGRAKQLPFGQFTGFFKPEAKSFKNYKLNPKFKQAGLPKRNPHFVERNLATYKLDQLLGAGVIPPTFQTELDGQRGSLMQSTGGKSLQALFDEWHEATEDLQYKDKNSPGSKERVKALTEVRRQALEQSARTVSILRLLDFICGQVDRHPGNIHVVKDPRTGQFVAKGIDNDLSFGQATSLFKNYQTQDVKAIQKEEDGTFTVPFKFDAPFARRIIAVARTPRLVREALAGLLSPSEIDSTVNRLTRLARILAPIVEKGDPSAVWN